MQQWIERHKDNLLGFASILVLAALLVSAVIVKPSLKPSGQAVAALPAQPVEEIEHPLPTFDVPFPRSRPSAPMGNLIRTYKTHIAKTASLAAVVGPLAVKIESIVENCGSKVISAYRPGARVIGSGRPSLHAVYPSRAVDIVNNPSCIYRNLKGWPGGYSVDYAAVHHVHVSYEPRGREWHARFRHYGTHYARHQHKSHRHVRYAAR